MNFRKLKLAPKIAMIVSAMLVVIFSIFIITTIIMTGGSLNRILSEEFTVTSKLNGSQVQQILDAASIVSKDMENYLSKAYAMEAAGKKNMAGDTFEAGAPTSKATRKSMVTKTGISELNSDVEKYLIETARSNATNNPDIYGVGAMFEPFKFDAEVKDYSFYITEEDAEAETKLFAPYDEYSKKNYYALAAQTKKTVFTQPYQFEGKSVITAAVPIIFQDELMGITLVDINITNFSKMEIKNAEYPTLFATVYSDDGNIIWDSESLENTNRNMSEFYTNKDQLAEVMKNFAGNTAFSYETTREDGQKYTRFFEPISAGEAHWWAQTALQSSDMKEEVANTTILLVAMSIVALLVIIIVTIVVLRKMINPIGAVVKAAEDISQGHLDIDIRAKSGDEIGVLSVAFNNTATVLRTVIRDISNVLSQLANRNLDVQTNATYVGDLVEIENSMKLIIDNLNDVMGNINQASDQVSSGSDQVSGGAQALSQGATEQASSVEELSATISEISSQVKQNANNASEARSKMNGVGKEIEQSNRQMQEMMTAMADISTKSSEIGKIIKTIEDIAFQTNILALNAAVEAARAGAAGKGFAVVADEVRNLASKSAEAAKGTTALIEGSIKAVENGTRIADATAKSLLTVVGGAKQVMITVDDISNASSEQAGSIAQVTMGVDQISSVVQTNSATAEESAAASEELSGQAQMLKSLVSSFTLRDGANSYGSTNASEPKSNYEHSSFSNDYSSDKY